MPTGEEPTVSCDATKAVGGCPWEEAFQRDHPGVPVYGMFGVSCWYRGKMGTYMLRRLADGGYELPEEIEDFIALLR